MMSREERRKVYKEGYEQGRFDERMDNLDNRPPTEQEVCEALGEYLGEEIIYDSGSFINRRRTAEVCAIGNLGLFYTVEPLPLRLITIIVRFYEKESERE